MDGQRFDWLRLGSPRVSPARGMKCPSLSSHGNGGGDLRAGGSFRAAFGAGCLETAYCRGQHVRRSTPTNLIAQLALGPDAARAGLRWRRLTRAIGHVGRKAWDRVRSRDGTIVRPPLLA